MKIKKYKSAEWQCRECNEGEDPGFCNFENTRRRAKYHAEKTGHKVHFIISIISTYEKE